MMAQDTKKCFEYVHQITKVYLISTDSPRDFTIVSKLENLTFSLIFISGTKYGWKSMGS